MNRKILERSWITTAAIMALLLSSSMVAVAAEGPPSGARGHFIVALNEGVDSESAAQDLSRAHDLRIGLVFDTVLNGFSATVPLNRVRAVESDSRVRVVVEDTFTPDVLDPHAQNLPTGIDRVDAEPTGSTTNTGLGVTIATLDTGIERGHPDLNVVGRITLATGGNGDKNGHGTHVSGTAAALDNTTGVVGVAPGADLYDVKVLSNSGGTRYSWLIAGLEYVADPNDDGNTSDHLDVANMSWGVPPDSGGLLADALISAWDAGVTTVTSAGNEGEDVDEVGKLPQALGGGGRLGPAGAEDKIIVVSAIDDSDGKPGGDTFASFSNFGSEVDIAAPGVGILSLWVNGFLATASGTSMASPHVTGTAALAIKVYRDANAGASPTPTQVANDLIINGFAQHGSSGFTDDPDHGDGESHVPGSLDEPLVNAGPFATAGGGGGTPNNAPVADAGTDQVVNEGVLVTLDGTGSSDPDVEPITYSWEQTAGPTVTLSDSTSASPTFTSPSVVADTVLTFQLTVSDGAATNSDSVNVTVLNNVNEAPVANAGADQSVNEGVLVTLNGTESFDPNEDPITYSWAQTGGPSVTLSDSASPSPTFTAPDVTGPTDLTFQLTVTDIPHGAFNTDSTVVTVSEPAAGNDMYSAAIDLSSRSRGKGGSMKDLKAEVTINEDVANDGDSANDTAASDATVTVDVFKDGDPTPVIDDATAITNGGGVAKFQWKDVGTGDFTVTVVNVTQLTLNYNALKNVETSDSITIS